MEIEQINVENFAKDEYPGIEIEDIDGRDTAIIGGNRSGKTLTFNAILYDLLGSKNTIDLTTGSGNTVKLEFTDGIKFHRGKSGAEYHVDDKVISGREAREQFESNLANDVTDDIDSDTVIRSHFLHSHLDRLPLSSLSQQECISIIRSAVSPDTQNQIEHHRKAHEHLHLLVEKRKADLGRVEDDQEELQDEKRNAQNQKEDYERILELLESGELAEIADRLETDQEIRNQLSDLYKEKENLRQTKRSKQKLRKKWQRYQENARNSVIAEATNDFVCPVCEGRVSPEKAERRLSRSSCPFCAEKRDLGELKEEIDRKIDQSKGEVDELTEEIEEIKGRIGKIKETIADLKEEKPKIAQLDSFVERKLRQNSYEIDGLKEEAEVEYEKTAEKISSCKGRIGEFDNQIEELERRISAYEDSLESAREEIDRLEAESRQEEVETFRKVWSDKYQEVAGDIGLDIVINDDDEIVIPGNQTQRRYRQAGDLSDSEIRLLNVSFAVTLNEFVRGEYTEWNTIIMDEPFTNLDEDGKSNLIDFISSTNQQFVFTTSDESFQDEFEVTAEMTRERIQSTLTMFGA